MAIGHSKETRKIDTELLKDILKLSDNKTTITELFNKHIRNKED